MEVGRFCSAAITRAPRDIEALEESDAIQQPLIVPRCRSFGAAPILRRLPTQNSRACRNQRLEHTPLILQTNRHLPSTNCGHLRWAEKSLREVAQSVVLRQSVVETVSAARGRRPCAMSSCMSNDFSSHLSHQCAVSFPTTPLPAPPNKADRKGDFLR